MNEAKGGVEVELDRVARVVSMDAESARRFFGAPAGTEVIDLGPPSDPSRWKPGARRYGVRVAW